MNPSISNIINEGNELKFTLAGTNISLANAIRRVVLSDIPVTVIDGDNSDITANTSRLHNEILKHRLGCIPVHMTDLEMLPGKYMLEINKENTNEPIEYVTTEDFRIKNIETKNYITAEEQKRIFPANSITNMYIDFTRLRAGIGNHVPGEKLQLTADFVVKSAADNSMYNIVSSCSYGNTMDPIKINEVWGEHSNKLKAEGLTESEIEMQKKNFYILDAQRHFIEDCFDFTVNSIGIYENAYIIRKACEVLEKRFADLILAADSDILPIRISEVTMDHSYDIVLENEDYTIGKVLEYVLYEQFFKNEGILKYCGFKKFHPHNDESIIRLAYYNNAADKTMVAQNIRMACSLSIDYFAKVRKMF